MLTLRHHHALHHHGPTGRGTAAHAEHRA